jgi:hypothetical protein
MNSKMSNKSPTLLAIAAVLITLPPLFAQAPQDQQASQEAAKMVAATGSFTSVIDSQKTPPGSQFRVKVDKKIHLLNGPELPAGTMLVGQVVNDDTQSGTTAKLALNFTEADLKNGQKVPIKATIIKIYKLPDPAHVDDYSVSVIPLDWTPTTINVDQTGVLSGVDFHSSIDGPNSGVFVSTKKDNIKLSPQYGVELAIAPGDQQQAAQQNPPPVNSTQ